MGDGKADNVDAFQAALSAAQDNGGTGMARLEWERGCEGGESEGEGGGK